jgi:SAM-dependent methyltransferase
MDRSELYYKIAKRKLSDKDYGPYIGDNGRVNKCVDLMRKGEVRTGGVLLDIGGGTGDLCDAVKDLYEIRICADISYDNLKAARDKRSGIVTWEVDVDKSGLPLHFLAMEKNDCVGSKGSWDWASKAQVPCVDTITALDFIEHIIDPENFARECFRLLKPGGQVFVNTPNIQYWEHILKLCSGRMPHTSGDRDVYHGGHLAFFTYLDLCEIFTGAGFTNCVQMMDEEGYRKPPRYLLDFSAQLQNKEADMRFGCPNLLFRATKPDEDTDW